MPRAVLGAGVEWELLHSRLMEAGQAVRVGVHRGWAVRACLALQDSMMTEVGLPVQLHRAPACRPSQAVRGPRPVLGSRRGPADRGAQAAVEALRPASQGPVGRPRLALRMVQGFPRRSLHHERCPTCSHLTQQQASRAA